MISSDDVEGERLYCLNHYKRNCFLTFRRHQAEEGKRRNSLSLCQEQDARLFSPRAAVAGSKQAARTYGEFVCTLEGRCGTTADTRIHAYGGVIYANRGRRSS